MIAQGALERGGRVACFAHREEIIGQLYKRMAQFEIPTGPGTRVQIMSYQTAVARDEVPEATVAIFDEAHHVAADEWKRVPDAYANVTRIGLTATPERGDGLGLGHAFDSMITVAQYSELIASGLLVPAYVIAGPPLKAGQIVARPVDAYRAHGRGQCVVFAPHVKAAREFAEQFTAEGITAAVVWDKMGKDKRAATLAAYARAEIRVLCNVAILTEGWDDPPTETIILARMFGSAGLYIQCGGRGARPWGTKRDFVLLDLVGNATTHGSPTEDRMYSLDGVGIQRLQGPGVSFCRKCGAVSGTCACEPEEQTPPEVVGDASQLKPWIAAMREEPDDRRVARLRKWFAEAEAKGHKPGAALFKFKAVYGHWPDARLRAEARR
jgi:superfamily II DNA or RNA helicase